MIDSNRNIIKRVFDNKKLICSEILSLGKSSQISKNLRAIVNITSVHNQNTSKKNAQISSFN